MFLLILSFATAFLIGLLVKAVDNIEDIFRKNNKKMFLIYFSALFGLIYGIGIAFFISFWPLTFTIAVGTLIGLIFSKKIDAKGHYFGFLGFIVGVLVFVPIDYFYSIGVVEVILILIFVFANLLDEKSDALQSRWKVSFFGLRPFLEIAALLVSIFSGKIIIWTTIFFFDLGYNITAKLFKNTVEK